MAPPPKDTIVAAVAALRADARVWRNASAELRTAGQFAVPLNLDASDFSYVGEKVGLPPVYQQVHEKLTVLLREGSVNCDNVALALNQAADGYDRDEQLAVHEMLGAW